MRRFLIVLFAAALGATPAAATMQAGGLKLSTAHDATNAVWFIDVSAAGGASLVPTNNPALRFEPDFWFVTNHTTVNPIHVRVHGRWAPNYDGDIDTPAVTEDYLVIELVPGETFRMDRQRKPLVGVTVADIIPNASEYVFVWGWH